MALALSTMGVASASAQDNIRLTPISIADTGYQYAPSIIYERGVFRMWFCGRGHGDVIYLATSADGRTWSTPQQVFEPEPGQWDGRYVCDPSVVENVTPGWRYTMYYTGTDDPAGTNNGFGAAFSNDGVHWVRWPGNPIRRDRNAFPYFGIGMPTAVRIGEKRFVYWNHVDAQGLGISRAGDAGDGVTLVGDTETGFTLQTQDVVYLPDSGHCLVATDNALQWVGIYESEDCLEPTRLLYRVGSASTGDRDNHNAGFVRGPDGSAVKPDVELVFATGNAWGVWQFRRGSLALADFEDGVDPAAFTASLRTAGVSPLAWAPGTAGLPGVAGSGDASNYFDCFGDGGADGICDLHLAVPAGMRDMSAFTGLRVRWAQRNTVSDENAIAVWIGDGTTYWYLGQVSGVPSGEIQEHVFPLPDARSGLTDLILRLQESDWGGTGTARLQVFSLSILP